MENANRAKDAMELHKQGYSNKEVADIMGVSIGRVAQLLQKARNPKIHEIQGHYKKLITSPAEEFSIRGRYISVTLRNLLCNILLQPDDSYMKEKPKIFNIVEFLYHNIWIARIDISGGDYKMIDSAGFQHKTISGSYNYNQATWIPSGSTEAKKVFFPYAENPLESKAMTIGWTWFDPIKKGIWPHRFIIKFNIYKPGDTSGWVQDHETFEFEFADISVVDNFTKYSFDRLVSGEIGQPLEDSTRGSLDITDDLQIQKQEIEQPVQTIVTPQYSTSDIPTDVMTLIRKKATNEWPDNYQLQLYVIEKQTNAYLSLRRYKVDGVPPNVIKRIRKNAITQWPDDFVMQKYEIDIQVKSYIELNKG